VNTEPEFEKLVPTDEMTGEDEEDSSKLRTHLQEARAYLRKFPWCLGIRREFFGLGVGGVVGVFLFELDSTSDADGRLWVITGDLPSAYLVTDQAPTPMDALGIYCGLMDDWIRAVRENGNVSDVFPVESAATRKNADLLEKRIRFLREEIIPAFSLDS